MDCHIGVQVLKHPDYVIHNGGHIGDRNHLWDTFPSGTSYLTPFLCDTTWMCNFRGHEVWYLCPENTDKERGTSHTYVALSTEWTHLRKFGGTRLLQETRSRSSPGSKCRRNVGEPHFVHPIINFWQNELNPITKYQIYQFRFTD